MKYKCLVFLNTIVAGRESMVKEIEAKEALSFSGGGYVLIAEVGLNRNVQGQLSFMLAAYVKAGSIHTDDLEKVADALVRRSVRLMAGEFGDSLIAMLSETRKRMRAKVCAMSLCPDKDDGAVVEVPSQTDGTYKTVKVASSAMILAGPVGRIQMLETRGSGESVVLASVNRDSYEGEWGKDAACHWPVLGLVKQKEVLMILPHTQKLLVYIGAATSNRSFNALRARFDTMSQRAEKWGSQSWAQRFRRNKWQR